MNIIAEIGVNHEGSLSLAKHQIELAAAAGVSHVKLQAYRANSLVRSDASAYWDESFECTEKQTDLFMKYETFDPNFYRECSLVAAKCKVKFGLSIFDLKLMRELGPLCDFIKIASGDLTFNQLVKAAAELGKPLMISTGASTIDEMVSLGITLRELLPNAVNSGDITIMHCSLSYPSSMSQLKLNYISKLKELFPDYNIGYSDHLRDPEVYHIVIARALGATVLEKHFTHDSSLQGNDHYHSGDYAYFKKVLDVLSFIEPGLTGSDYFSRNDESRARMGARRSMTAARYLAVGHILEEEDVIMLRPGDGLPPGMLELLVGSKVCTPIDAGEPLKLDNFRRPY
jgi:sialic acid synthase SpsE